MNKLKDSNNLLKLYYYLIILIRFDLGNTPRSYTLGILGMPGYKLNLEICLQLNRNDAIYSS